MEIFKSSYKDKRELIDKARENARENYGERTVSYYCTFKAIYDLVDTDLPFESVKLLDGFFGGFCLSGNICGALSGGAAAIGLVLGSAEPEFSEDFREIIKSDLSGPEKAKLMSKGTGAPAVYNQLVNRFEEKYGTIKCSELFEPWKEDPICVPRYKQCMEIIMDVAEIVAELLYEIEEEGLESFEMGENLYSYLLEEK